MTMLLRVESCICLSKNLTHDATSGSTDTQLSYNDDNVFISQNHIIKRRLEERNERY